MHTLTQKMERLLDQEEVLKRERTRKFHCFSIAKLRGEKQRLL